VVIGVGGLGAAAALELAEAGVARIGLIDADRVEVSNLHRQLLHGPGDVGRPKAEAAAEKLRRVYPSLRVLAEVARVTADNASALLGDYDVAIDATDNARAKFLLNDVCVAAGRTLVHAGVTALRGQLFTVFPHRSACLRCLFPEAPEDEEIASCSEAGILGPLAAMIGALQAREALAALSGEPAADRLLTVDAGSLTVREIPLRRSPRCPACGPLTTTAAEHARAAAGSAAKEMS
jgi:molybdopterin/thiamine biosynthesis adenylyltransferase